MKITAIHSQSDYESALARVEKLMDAAPGSPEEDELERLAILIEQYEEIHFPIAPPDPAEARKFRVEQESEPSPATAGG